MTLALYLLYLALQRESIFYFALGGLAAGLGFYTYTASRLGFLVGAAFLGLLLVVKLLTRFRIRRRPAEIKAQSARQFRHWLAGSAVFAVVGLATVAPHLVYTNAVAPELLRYKTLESLLPNVNYALSFFPAEELFRDYAPLRVGNEIFFYRLDLYARLFVRNIARSLLVFHDSVLADAEYLTSPLSGTVGVFFYTVGLLVALRNFRHKEFALMLLWWFGGVFFLSIISTFPARFQHMIPIIPMIALFTAIGLTVTVNAITERIRLPRVSLNQRSFGVVAGVLLAVIVGTNLYSYFVQMPQRYLPDMENIMSFTALNLRQPTHLVYVYATVDRSNWTPWMITYIPNQATYQTIKVDEFGLNPPLHMLFATGQSYIVFFDQDAMMPVLSMMRLLFPTLQAPPVIYHDISNRVLGMSYTFVAP